MAGPRKTALLRAGRRAVAMTGMRILATTAAIIGDILATNKAWAARTEPSHAAD